MEEDWGRRRTVDRSGPLPELRRIREAADAQKPIGAGNDVSDIEWRGTVHGFMMMDRFTPASSRKLVGRIAEWCNSLWNS